MMRKPSRSQLREETYQSLRSRLLELIGEGESGQQDAQMLETFHRCENFNRIENPRENVKNLETFHICENFKRIKNPRCSNVGNLSQM